MWIIIWSCNSCLWGNKHFNSMPRLVCHSILVDWLAKPSEFLTLGVLSWEAVHHRDCTAHGQIKMWNNEKKRNKGGVLSQSNHSEEICFSRGFLYFTERQVLRCGRGKGIMWLTLVSMDATDAFPRLWNSLWVRLKIR